MSLDGKIVFVYAENERKHFRLNSFFGDFFCVPPSYKCLPPVLLSFASSYPLTAYDRKYGRIEDSLFVFREILYTRFTDNVDHHIASPPVFIFVTHYTTRRLQIGGN